MSKNQVCYPNSLGRWIRVSLCLAVIIAAVIFKRWIGLLAVVPLLSALQGSCGSGISFRQRIKSPRK